MRILVPATKNKVYSVWLKSELYRMGDSLTQEEIQIIENPDLDNVDENSEREDLLLNKYGRVAILDKLPQEVIWYEVSIEDNDLDNLYILAIWDWFLDSGRTFKLSEVPANLSTSRGHRVSNFPPAADHKTKIEAMAQSINDNIQDIVMISSNQSGPYTIIDGTHRSSLLTINGNLSGTRAYLGVANNLSQCVWTQEWVNYQNSIAELNRLVDEGYLW